VGGCPRLGYKGDRRAIYDDGDGWDDNGDFPLADEERVRGLQGRDREHRVAFEEEDEGLRRAFEVQMRLVEEVRRELEVTEARRLRYYRERESRGGGGGGADGHVIYGQRRLKRRRRRRPHDVKISDDERRRRERRDAAPPRQMEDGSMLGLASGAAPGRTRSRFRAFLYDAIDVRDHLLFGGSSWKRRE